MSVDLLAQRPQTHTATGEILDEREELRQGTAQPIKPGGHHSVTGCVRGRQLVKAGTAGPDHGSDVSPHTPTTGRGQCIDLAGRAVITRRHLAYPSSSHMPEDLPRPTDISGHVLGAGAGTPPEPGLPPELHQRVGTVEMSTATPAEDLGPIKPDIELPVVLCGDMVKYNWMINGNPYKKTKPLRIRQGQQSILRFDNITMMWHPMHLHGHTFQVARPG